MMKGGCETILKENKGTENLGYILEHYTPMCWDCVRGYNEKDGKEDPATECSSRMFEFEGKPDRYEKAWQRIYNKQKEAKDE